MRFVRGYARGALVAVLLACGAPGEPAAPRAQRLDVGPVAAPKLVAEPASTVLLRFVERPDPGSERVPTPAVAELPNGDIIVAGTAWETDLGPGAERIANGFVSAFGPDGRQRWMCLSDSPPSHLNVDAEGVTVAMARAAAESCGPNAGKSLPGGRWGAPRTPELGSAIYGALDGRGTPRWSIALSSAGLWPLLRTSSGAKGTLALLGGLPGDVATLAVVDAVGKTRWSRKGKLLQPNGGTVFPAFAPSADGGLLLFTGDSIGFTASSHVRSLVRLDAEGRTLWSALMDRADGRGRDETLRVHGIAFDGDDALVLGSATHALQIGGRQVPHAENGGVFLARFDGGGRARWVHVVARERGFGADDGAELLRAADGGAVVVIAPSAFSRSGGPGDADTLLVKVSRDGLESRRLSLSLLGDQRPYVAASLRGDSVLVSVSVTTLAEQRRIFPAFARAPAPAGQTVLVGRIPL